QQVIDDEEEGKTLAFWFRHLDSLRQTVNARQGYLLSEFPEETSVLQNLSAEELQQLSLGLSKGEDIDEKSAELVASELATTNSELSGSLSFSDKKKKTLPSFASSSLVALTYFV
ncbi:unnamed protein product, partial [Amoebophrya sp. A25]